MGRRGQGDAITRLGQDLRLEAGDLAVTLHCGGDGVPVSVTLQRTDGPQKMDAEQIERLAAIVAVARSSAGDSREICPAHGYYDPPTDYDYRSARCPECRLRDQEPAPKPSLAAVPAGPANGTVQ